jgi:hypothetical protein
MKRSYLIAVDETMYNGGVRLLQYCPLKLTKWSLKSFGLANSDKGFSLNIIPHTGGETKDVYLSNCNTHLPIIVQTVMALVEKYLDKGHHVFVDWLHFSVPLVDELDRRSTGYTGTLIKSWQQLPGNKFRMCCCSTINKIIKSNGKLILLPKYYNKVIPLSQYDKIPIDWGHHIIVDHIRK